MSEGEAVTAPAPEHVLVLAPMGRDAALCCRVLREASIDGRACDDVAALAREIANGAGAAVIVEESLTGEALAELGAVVERQPEWSDFPVIVLTAQAVTRRKPLHAFAPLGNVSVLERPTDPKILISATLSALRARRRQYAANAARIRDEAELRLAEEFQRQLIGIAGHDLRNPLASMLMAASIVARLGPEEHERRKQLVEKILSSGMRMERLIGDLADYSRARIGSPLPLSVRLTDFHRVCETVIDDLGAAGRARIAYEPEGDPLGLWDPDRLAQVIQNLLTNAMKYGAEDAPIRLHWTRTLPHRLVVRVSNAGAPIPAALLPHIFEPFRLGEQTEGSGTRSLGLGLFIVREIVRAHGGTIGVKSSAEDGTTFTAEIPVVMAR